MLRLDGLCKSFDGLRAVNDFSMTVKSGMIVGLVGPNGAGKSTVFNLVTGFLRSDEGDIRFEGKPLRRLSPHQIVGVGMSRTFQDLRLIGRLTVLENVLLSFPGQTGERLWGSIAARRCHRQETQNRETAHELLAFVGLSEKAEELAGEVSYGQQKLLSLACCVATNARLLLLDEPVAGVAPHLVEQIVHRLRQMREQGKTMVVIEHNLQAVADLCDKVVVMDDGKKIAEGTWERVSREASVLQAYLA